MEYPLRHQPARLGRVALKLVVLVGRALFFWPRNILHRIGRPMAVTGTAQDAAAAALVEILGVQPFFHPFEAERFVVFVCHWNERLEKIVNALTVIACHYSVSIKRRWPT